MAFLKEAWTHKQRLPGKWQANVLHTASFLVFILSRILLTSCVEVNSCRSAVGSADFTADSVLRRSKRVCKVLSFYCSVVVRRFSWCSESLAPYKRCCLGLSRLCWWIFFASLIPTFTLALVMSQAFLLTDQRQIFGSGSNPQLSIHSGFLVGQWFYSSNGIFNTFRKRSLIYSDFYFDFIAVWTQYISCFCFFSTSNHFVFIF